VRLSNVERGDSLEHKLIFGMIRLMSGYRAPDVIRTLVYRKAFFGKHHAAHTQAVMRGPSAWSIGERELFAAYVSDLNKCRF
jgi:hypothetical protein